MPTQRENERSINPLVLGTGFALLAGLGVLARLSRDKPADASLRASVATALCRTCGRGGDFVWLAMLVAGVYALIRSNGHPEARIVLGGSLAFQSGLHLLYGGETFLYSIQWWDFL